MQPVDPLIAALAEICGKHKTARKILFLPNLAHGTAVLERLARAGHPWLNLTAKAPGAYAAEFAPVTGKHMPASLGPAIMAQLLSEAPPSPRFEKLAGTPGVAAAVWRSIKDLRMAGLSSKDVHDKAFLSHKRAAEIRHLLKSYEEFLAKNGWMDDAEVMQGALTALRKPGAAHSGDILLIPQGVPWSQLEKDFLDALPGTRIAVEIASADAEPFPPSRKDDLRVFRAVSQDAEAREVLRRILDSRLPFDEVEISLAGGAFDKAVLWDLCQRLKIPCTVSDGLPMAITRPGKALLGYLRWVESGFEVGPLLRLLRSGVLSVKAEGEALSGNEAARALERFSLYKGLKSYPQVLEAHVSEVQASIADLKHEGEDEKAAKKEAGLEKFKRIRAGLTDLLSSVAWAADGKKARLDKAVEGCLHFLQGHVSTGSEFDVSANAGLCDALSALAMLSGRETTLTEACALLREAVASMSVGAGRAKEGHLHLTSLQETGWEGREHTFVTGLTMAAYPGRPAQDPFLLDEERENIHPLLETSIQSQARLRKTVRERLSVLRGSTAFSCPTYDNSEGRESAPASLFLDAVRCFMGNPSLTYTDIGKSIGEPVGLTPEDSALAVDELSWWLRRGVRQPLVEDSFPPMKDGREALEARTKAEWGVFDGHVPSAAGKFDPTQDGKPVSAGFMGELAHCPFRFFLERILGIRSKEEEERDPLQWLTAMERGILLHEVYSRFLRELRKDKEAPDPKKHLKRILAMTQEALEEQKAVLPPLSDGLFEQEKAELLRDAELFLDRVSSEWETCHPVAFEVAFGMKKDGEGDPLDSRDPVEVDFEGRKFQIHGRIDRVDRIGDDRYEVVDYKTGRYSAMKEEIHLPAEIQPMFYLKALETLLRKKHPKAAVEAFTFLYSAVKGSWSKVRRRTDMVDKVGAMMAPLLKLLRKGIFLYSCDKDECRYCPYTSVCGDDPAGRAQSLLESDPGPLEPIKTLGEL